MWEDILLLYDEKYDFKTFDDCFWPSHLKIRVWQLSVKWIRIYHSVSYHRSIDLSKLIYIFIILYILSHDSKQRGTANNMISNRFTLPTTLVDVTAWTRVFSNVFLLFHSKMFKFDLQLMNSNVMVE